MVMGESYKVVRMVVGALEGRVQMAVGGEQAVGDEAGPDGEGEGDADAERTTGGQGEQLGKPEAPGKKAVAFDKQVSVRTLASDGGWTYKERTTNLTSERKDSAGRFKKEQVAAKKSRRENSGGKGWMQGEEEEEGEGEIDVEGILAKGRAPAWSGVI